MTGPHADGGDRAPHVIRLGAAWRPAGAGRHARRFHRPTGLDPGVRVWLVVDRPERSDGLALDGLALDGLALDGLALDGATLNGSPLDLASGRADITDRLLLANEIVLATPHEPLLGGVRLEIFDR